jgi:hypothetical protein
VTLTSEKIRTPLFTLFDVTPLATVYTTEPPNWENIAPLDFSAWSPFGTNGSVSNTPQDVSATLKTAASNMGLHLLITVRDDAQLQNQPPDEMWKQDSLQIAFDVDANSPWLPNSGHFLNGHRIYEYGAALYAAGSKVYRWRSYDPQLPADKLEPDVTAKITREGNFTTYDLTFPWRTLGLASMPKIPSQLGFSLAVNDADPNATRHGLRLFGGIVESKDPLQYGRLWLR